MKKVLLFTVLFGMHLAALAQGPQETIILDASKDAQIWSWDPDGVVDRGTTRRDIVAYEWTKNGVPTTKYGLIDFDLNQIPEGAKIISATLYLYHDPISVDLGHSQLSGSNDGRIVRVTSDWTEAVSWGGQPSYDQSGFVRIQASESETQDYEINLKPLVMESLRNPENSFGFAIQLNSTQHYRSLVFASSEHPYASLHPKLEVTYVNPGGGPPASADKELTLSASKDAQVWSWDPDGIADRGTTRRDIVAYEWTKNGVHTTKYGLIDFDLSQIPAGTEISNATLYLYHDPISVDLGHSQLSGSNAGRIERVTSDWEETVSWGIKPTSDDTKSVPVPASTSEDQDYAIDLTSLVQASVNDPENSFGYVLKINATSPYRSLVFASSEHPDASLHPRLVVTCVVPDDKPPLAQGDEATTEELSDPIDALALKVYPNPGRGLGKVTIQSGQSAVAELKVYNQRGDLMRTVSDAGTNAIVFNDLPSGLYFLHSIGEDGTVITSTLVLN